MQQIAEPKSEPRKPKIKKSKPKELILQIERYVTIEF